MSIYLKFLRLFLVLMVGVFFLVGSTPDKDENSENITPMEMTIDDNVLIPENILNIESISNIENNNSIIINGDIENSSELIDKIIFIPPSKDVQSGMFLKVEKIEREREYTTFKMKTRIFYIVPELNEVISKLKIEEKNMINKNTNVTQVTIPTSTSISGSSPSLKKYNKINTIYEKDGKHTGGFMFGNAGGAIDFKFINGKKNSFKFSFNNLKIWEAKKKVNNMIPAPSIVLDGSITTSIKNMTPVANIDKDDYKLKFDTEIDTNIDTDVKVNGKFDFSLTKLLEENNGIQCGTAKYIEELGNKDGTYTKMSFSGAKWQDNLCLGGIQITAGSITMLTGNGNKSVIPLSVDVFLTMNSKFKITAEAKLSLSYHQLTKTGINVDIKNSDIKKRLSSYRESYDPDLYNNGKGQKKPATLKLMPSGKLSGSVSKQMGLAIGLRVANIYPAVIEAYGAVEAKGEVSTMASFDANGNALTDLCAKVEFIPKVGVYASIGLAFNGEVTIVEPFYKESYQKDFQTGFYYNYEYPFISTAKYDTCSKYKGKVTFDVHQTSGGLTVNNINIRDKSKRIERYSFRVYNSDAKLVAESFNKESVTFNLSSGEYVVELFMILSTGETYIGTKLIYSKSVPTNINVDLNGYDATISWNEISGATEYQVCLSKQEIINGICSENDISTTTSNSLVYTLDGNTQYYVGVSYRVDSVQSDMSEIKTFTINESNGDFDLLLKSATNTHLNLSWIGESGDNNNYKVCQSDTKISYQEAKYCDNEVGVFLPIQTSKTLAISTYLDSPLEKNKDYYFRVVAYNTNDEVVGVSTELIAQLAKDTELPVESPSKIKKTGQTKSYDQDGNEVTDRSIQDDGFYQKGVTPNYTRDNIKKIVTDHITGLEWQDNEEAKTIKKNWEDAKDYCANTLRLGGYSDWRLPTRKELQSIVEFNRNHFLINSKFLNTSDVYWSSTSVINSGYKWFFPFNGDEQNHLTGEYEFGVRCVRSHSTE